MCETTNNGTLLWKQGSKYPLPSAAYYPTFQMPTAIEHRVFDETETTRGSELDAKRDDVPAVDASSNSSNGSVRPGASLGLNHHIATMKDEIQYRDEAYRQRKSLLEQILTDYDKQHHDEKSLFQKKISELQRETESHQNQSLNELESLKDAWDCKFDGIQASMEDALEQEREERSAAFQDIEEQLILRDNEVDGLLDVIAKQSDELKQAKIEREELKKEMKNILVTLHVQFERLENQAFKSESEVILLREDHKTVNETVYGEIDTLKQCITMVQENLNKAKQDVDDSIANTKDTIVGTQREIQTQFHKVLEEQQSIVVDHLQRKNDTLENINADIRHVRTEQENYKLIQETMDRRLAETEERAQKVEFTITECQNDFKELNDYVHNEADETIQALLSEKDDILIQLQWLSEQMNKAQEDIMDVYDKYNGAKIEKEFDEAKWKESFAAIESQVQEQGSVFNNDISSMQQNLKTVVELLSTKLADLRVEMHANQKSQKVINGDFTKQHNAHEENLQTKHKSIELSNKEVADSLEKIKLYEKQHEAIKTQLMNTQAKHEVELHEYQSKIDDWNVKFDGLMKIIQQRSEAQLLASKEFKVKQTDMDQKMKSCDTHLSSLQRRVAHAENCLSQGVTADLVQVILQPYIRQNDNNGDTIKKHADDLKTMKDQMKSTQMDRNAVTQKVDNMNKTWESLFQHLVGQVTKDTMDMNAMKKENENVLKDMQRLSASWEKQFEHLSKEQNASKQALMTISSLRANMESCNHRIACLVDEIESQRVSHSTLQEQKVSLDLSMKELREDVRNQADAALQVQKNVLSERTKQIIDETDNKIQDVITSYAREFAKTQEDSQEVWKAITTLKDVTKGFEQTMHSHRAAAKKDLEDCKYEARGLRLQLRATRETAIHSENNKSQNHHEPLLK